MGADGRTDEGTLRNPYGPKNPFSYLVFLVAKVIAEEMCGAGGDGASIRLSFKDKATQTCGAGGRDSASSFHWLSRFIFNVRLLFVRLSRIGNISSHLLYMVAEVGGLSGSAK